MIINLAEPSTELFSPTNFIAAMEALVEDNLYIITKDGTFKAVCREAYKVQIGAVCQGGIDGLYNGERGFGVYLGAATMLLTLISTEARLAGPPLDESEIPFGEAHVESAPEEEPQRFQPREATEEDIADLMAELDSIVQGDVELP